MYETSIKTWIIGALVGAALALGLMAAGGSYVRVAQTIAPYGVDVVQFEPVTITAQKRADNAAGTTTNTAGAAAANPVM